MAGAAQLEQYGEEVFVQHPDSASMNIHRLRFFIDRG